jgi:hypothetical protein
MSLSRYFKVLLTVLLFISSTANASTTLYRWTQKTQVSDTLQSILPELNKESSLSLTENDFKEVERRNLANHRFTHYLQLSQGVPVKGAMIRTWVDLKTGVLTQLEAHLESASSSTIRSALLQKQKIGYSALKAKMSQLDTMKFVQLAVAKTDDKRISDVKWSDQWDRTDLQRVIEVTSRRGTHKIVVSHYKQAIVSSEYQPFAQADIVVDALVYPIYEEVEKQPGTVLERVPVQLKNILRQRKEMSGDPYASLRQRRYFESKFNSVLAETAEGQKAGYWSFNWLNRMAQSLFASLKWVENSFANSGLLLIGKYATINLHPEVTKLSGIKSPLTHSGQLNYLWKQDAATQEWEVIPVGALSGQPLTDAKSAAARLAQRLPNHDPVTYINDGFDEIQVYYAIDRLMESLHGMGFTDPELSTRPFHAYLYDPDISMKDNAYYTNDTINFTTYSPNAQNYARDNTTIWHELGHGVMDRLMGESLNLADTGGLSEGMADFVAQLVVNDVTAGQSFPGSDQMRIVNKTSFHLTNESHDDGEAYGGAMKDMMDLAIQAHGRQGLILMTDLTLEAMRLSRNHPALTANDWFDHMLFADEIGSPIRPAGIFKSLIQSALETRNFRLDRGAVAEANVTVDGGRLDSKGPGSRYNPISHTLAKGQEASHTLALQLKGSPTFSFKYPVKIEVSFNGGPLQGAVKWKNESTGTLFATLNNEAELANFTVGATSGCDFVNREDGSCSDFAYIKVFNNGEAHPASKKRFYLQIVAP